MQRYRNCSGSAGFGSEVNKQRAGIVYGPGKEKYLSGRTFPFSGTNSGENGLEIVLWPKLDLNILGRKIAFEYRAYSGYSVATFLSRFENPKALVSRQSVHSLSN